MTRAITPTLCLCLVALILSGCPAIEGSCPEGWDEVWLQTSVDTKYCKNPATGRLERATGGFHIPLTD